MNDINGLAPINEVNIEKEIREQKLILNPYFNDNIIEIIFSYINVLKEKIKSLLYKNLQMHTKQFYSYFPDIEEIKIDNALKELYKEKHAIKISYLKWECPIPKKREKTLRYHIKKKLQNECLTDDDIMMKTEHYGYIQTFKKMIDEGIIKEQAGYDIVYFLERCGF